MGLQREVTYMCGIFVDFCIFRQNGSALFIGRLFQQSRKDDKF